MKYSRFTTANQALNYKKKGGFENPLLSGGFYPINGAFLQ
jgi:hypothetical protein